MSVRTTSPERKLPTVALAVMGLVLAFLAGRWQWSSPPQESSSLLTLVTLTLSSATWLISFSVVFLAFVYYVFAWMASTLRSGVPQRTAQAPEPTPTTSLPEPTAQTTAAQSTTAQATQGGVVRFGKSEVDVTTAQTLIAALATITFQEGKHAGKTFDQVAREDLPYAVWLKSHAAQVDLAYQLFVLFIDLRCRVG